MLMKKILITGALAIAITAMGQKSMRAADITFNDLNGGDSNWSTSGNWVGGVAPVAGDTARVSDGLTVDITSNQAMSQLNLANVAAGTDGTVNHTAGDVAVSDWMGVGKGGGGLGTYNQSGGTVTAAKVELGNNFRDSLPAVPVSNGTYSLSGSASLTETTGDPNGGNSGIRVGMVDTSVGILNISDSASVTAGDLMTVGEFGNGTVNHSGGTLTATGSAALSVGDQGIGTGEYNLSGSASADVQYGYIGFLGNGTVNQTGGSFVSQSWLSIGRKSGSTGEYNISGTSNLQSIANLEIGIDFGATQGGDGTLNITGDQVTINVGTLQVGDDVSGTGSLGFFTGSGISAINAFGGVQLAAGNASLEIDLSGYTGPSEILLVNNMAGAVAGHDGIGAGIFNGLPEGATVFGLSGSTATISYIGGDGNDIVLRNLNIVPEPTSLVLMSLAVIGCVGALRHKRGRRRRA